MELGEDGTLVIHPADGAAVAPVAAVAPNEIAAPVAGRAARLRDRLRRRQS
jgi:hypothetical protein